MCDILINKIIYLIKFYKNTVFFYKKDKFNVFSVQK